jgi:hypothetical protein
MTAKRLTYAMIAGLVIAMLAACGGSTADDPMVDAATSGLDKQCGEPGDTGNDLGVGKYCSQLSDCSGAASICAILGDPDAHFCTKTCTQGSTDACGTNATCACMGGPCGCVPNTCLQ